MKATYLVEGMHCAACVAKVEKILNNTTGVMSATANLITESVIIEYDKEIVNFNDLQQKIKNLGYKLIDNQTTTSTLDPTLIQIYQIEGMSCAACAAKIENITKKQSEVSQANVNLTTEQLTIIWKNKPNPNLIIDILQQLGYTATLILSAEEQYKQNQKRKEIELLSKKQQIIYLLVFTIPLFYLTMGPMIGLPVPQIIDMHHHPINNLLLQLILTTPVMWLGKDLLIRGFKSLWLQSPNMDSLVAVGTSAAYLQGIVMTIYLLLNPDKLSGHPDLYFESAAVILTLMKIGKYMEDLAKGKTSAAIKTLMDLTPETARRINKNGTVELIPLAMVQIGDILQVRPGDRLGVDGEIIEGSSTIDESMLTGESLPITKTIGDTVTGGSLNKTGSFNYRVNKIGQDTMISQIIRMVQEAQGSKAEIAKLADKISLYFVPIVIILALSSSLTWYFFLNSTLDFALKIFINVLIIACPCALGLATPTAIMVGTGLAAQKGILFKNGQALESLHQADAILLDKTGTITQGTPTVVDVILTSKIERTKLLSIVASVEATSEHPLGEAIVRYVKEQNINTTKDVHAFNSITGKGVTAIINNQSILIGNQQLIAESITLDSDILQQTTEFAKQGKTPIYVVIDHQLSAIITIADPIKETSIKAIEQLNSLNLDVYMVTGDHHHTANAIAKQVGITHIKSEVLPEDKSNIVTAIQNKGHKVIMVGDGINDAPALAAADIGIAIGSGTDIAIESADVVLIHDQLSDIISAIHLSHATLRTIKQNLFWAFAYNIIGIPVAMGMIYGLFNGPLLNPMVAALAMSFSSITVLLNALRLRFIKK